MWRSWSLRKRHHLSFSQFSGFGRSKQQRGEGKLRMESYSRFVDLSSCINSNTKAEFAAANAEEASPLDMILLDTEYADQVELDMKPDASFRQSCLEPRDQKPDIVPISQAQHHLRLLQVAKPASEEVVPEFYLEDSLNWTLIAHPGIMSTIETTSSVGSRSSNSTDEVELIDGGDSLQALPSRSRSVSQTLPLYRSNSLPQLQTANCRQIGDSVPCTQNAPLDSSTLRPQKPLLQRTTSMISFPTTSLNSEWAAKDGEKQTTERNQSISPSTSEGSKEAKVGRYSEQERKVRLERYRQKRSERNFQKKIKYACRKTLADSRPRVRGRFAKNDEVSDKLKIEDEEVDDLPIRRNHRFPYLIQY